MIWVLACVLLAAALAPLALVLRGPARGRGRREAAVALHRARLAEVDRDRAEGRIAEAEAAAARLEIERRLLAEAAPEPEAPRAAADRTALVAALAFIPAAAFALYLAGGSPRLPAGDGAAAQAAREQADQALIDQLAAVVTHLDPGSDQARQGYILLGGAQARRGDMRGAAEAWSKALAARFDPTLAAETAEAMTETAGRVTPEAADLFRRALDAAPPDAPWRRMAERRLAAG